jgi:hypothetical protein
VGPGFCAAFSLQSQRSAAFRCGLHLLRLVNEKRLVTHRRGAIAFRGGQAYVVGRAGVRNGNSGEHEAA